MGRPYFAVSAPASGPLLRFSPSHSVFRTGLSTRLDAQLSRREVREGERDERERDERERDERERGRDTTDRPDLSGPAESS